MDLFLGGDIRPNYKRSKSTKQIMTQKKTICDDVLLGRVLSLYVRLRHLQ